MHISLRSSFSIRIDGERHRFPFARQQRDRMRLLPSDACGKLTDRREISLGPDVDACFCIAGTRKRVCQRLGWCDTGRSERRVTWAAVK